MVCKSGLVPSIHRAMKNSSSFMAWIMYSESRDWIGQGFLRYQEINHYEDPHKARISFQVSSATRKPLNYKEQQRFVERILYWFSFRNGHFCHFLFPLITICYILLGQFSNKSLFVCLFFVICEWTDKDAYWLVSTFSVPRWWLDSFRAWSHWIGVPIVAHGGLWLPWRDNPPTQKVHMMVLGMFNKLFNEYSHIEHFCLEILNETLSYLGQK